MSYLSIVLEKVAKFFKGLLLARPVYYRLITFITFFGTRTYALHQRITEKCFSIEEWVACFDGLGPSGSQPLSIW